MAVETDRLEALLSNEVDVAFRWRVRTAFAYLNPQPGDKILDCGCGLGFHLMALSRLVSCHLSGLDHDVDRLSFAQRQLSRTQVSLCQSDIYHLPYGNERFDKVLLIEMLEHLDDDLAGLLEVWRVLKPSGMLVATVPYCDYPFLYDPINWLWERLFGHPIRTGPCAGIWTEHYRLYSRQDLLTCLYQAGFDVLDCQMLTHYCFPFTHNLVYTIGKGLLLQHRLPGFILDAVDRFHPETGKRPLWNPMTWIMHVIKWIDRLNTGASNQLTFVNIGVKARKRTERGA